MPSEPRAAIEAELSVVAESIDRYRERIAGLGQRASSDARAGSDHGAEDLVAALHEAERALRSAHRHLTRAVKLAR